MAEETAQLPSAQTEPAKGKGKKKKSSKRKKGARAANEATKRGTPLGFPKHPILKCLRIPQAVLERNAPTVRLRSLRVSVGVAKSRWRSVQLSSMGCSNARLRGRSNRLTSPAV